VLNANLTVLRSQFDAHWRIIHAVILQDMRTRFGRTYFSYLVAIIWPLAHLGSGIFGYVLVNKLAPVGEDPAVFLGSGLLPYILCLYPARMIGMAVAQNRQLLSIPRVRPMHLIVSRTLLEIVSSFIVCMIFYTVLWAADYDFMPRSTEVAAAAVCASLYFGVALGLFTVMLVALAGPFAATIVIIFMIPLYLVSGVYIVPWMMSPAMLDYESYNPLFGLVQWLRSAYYAAYEEVPVNKSGIIWISTSLLFLGLLGERYLRGKF
jgi:capsular polysaccharide transport system permease protein